MLTKKLGNVDDQFKLQNKNVDFIKKIFGAKNYC